MPTRKVSVLAGGSGRTTLKANGALPPLLRKNLEMRGLEWSWLPGWLTEPTPAGQYLLHPAIDWQMVVAVLFLEKSWPGKTWAGDD